MADPTILSGSSLNTWIECPREWAYVYLWRLERPPSFKMALGTAAHFAVEMAMKHRMVHGEYPSLGFWHDMFDTAFTQETKNSKPRNDRPEESWSTHWESGRRCVDFYARDIAPTIVPLAVEIPIRFRINGWVWTGTADLLEAINGDPKRVRIRDHKFTAKRPDNPGRYRWPMTGYAIGVRRKLDLVEEDVQLDYIIRNKKPVLFPISSKGPIADDEIIAFAQEIENAMATINKGLFPSLGTQTGACNWCPYWDICPDYRGRKRQAGYGVRPD